VFGKKPTHACTPRMDRQSKTRRGSTLKSELGERFDDPGRAKHQLFDYIEIFYNQRRRHSSLNYVRPGEDERAARLNETSAA